MKNCLILLSSTYPYFPQTIPFLDSEFPFLQKVFDKKIIFAFDVADPNQKKIELKGDTDSYNTSLISEKKAKAGDALRGAFNIFRKSEFYKYDREEIGNNPARRLFFEYFCERSMRKFEYCKKVLEKYDFSQYDSITIYSYWFFATAFTGSLIKDMLSEINPNIKFISRAHGYDVYKKANALNYLPLRKYLLERVDNVFVCSENGAETIKKDYPEFSEKISERYLGTFDCGKSEEGEKTLHILSCANVRKIKRVDMLAESLALLKDSGFKISWTHIGDGAEFQKLQKIVSEKLRFMETELKGKTAHSDVIEYYRNNPVDLFINTSSSEGLPVSIMEAASFGVPVIAPDIGGVGEIVKDGFNGYLLPADFTEVMLARTISEFYNLDAEKRKALRKNSRSVWEEKFDGEKNYSSFAEEITRREVRV